MIKDPSTVVLPIVFHNHPLIGVETWAGYVNDAQVYPYFEELQQEMIKMPVYWSQVEPQPGTYTWPVNYDRSVEAIRRLKAVPLLTIKAVPDWAREPGSPLCARPKDIPAFAKFVAEVARRYRGPIALEIGNEPNSPIGMFDWYGCWGNPDEPDYGGGYYRIALEAVYPAVKAINPAASIVAGALMTSCTNCPAFNDWTEAWADSPFYDALSFHYYSWTPDTSQLYSIIQSLRQVTNRPLWLDETAIRASVCNHTQEQNSVSWAESLKKLPLEAVVWFILPPDTWECTPLLNSDWSRKPVYYHWVN